MIGKIMAEEKKQIKLVLNVVSESKKLTKPIKLVLNVVGDTPPTLD